MMKNTTVGLLAVLLAGCSVTSRLERRQSRALADYAPHEQAAPKPAQTRNYMTVKHDSTTYSTSLKSQKMRTARRWPISG